MATVLLHALAHSRTGDKGDSQTLSVIAYDPADYALLHRVVTAAAVARHFAAVVHGPVTRYELPRLFALHFVLERALAGGVNDSLALDTHGKSRSSLLLDMAIEVPDEHRAVTRTMPRPFRLDLPQERLAALRVRLEQVSWPDQPPREEWATGTSLAFMRELVEYWCGGFDWRTREHGAALRAPGRHWAGADASDAAARLAQLGAGLPRVDPVADRPGPAWR